MESKCPDVTGYVQDDVNPYILHMFKGTFLLDMARIKLYVILIDTFESVTTSLNPMYT